MIERITMEIKNRRSVKNILMGLFLLSITSFSLQAAVFEVDGIKYKTDDRQKKVDVIGNNYQGDVVIPASVEYRGIVYKVTEIEDMAFSACSQLTSVTIPASVRDIDDEAFENSPLLQKIIVDPNNRYFKDVDGILYTKNMREIVLYPPGIKAESFSIPDGVREINARAFAGVTQLKKITLPNSLVEIEDEAFYGCMGLTEITVPEKVRELGDNIFGEAENLQSVYFEGNLPDAPDPDDIDEFIYASRRGNLIDATSYYKENKSGWNRIHNTWQGRPVEFDSR